jgi:hypothetical protein
MPYFKDFNIPDLEPWQFEHDLSVLLKVLKINNLYFTGGEPLLHNKLYELVKIAKYKKFANKLTIFTNCTLLNKFTDDILSILDGIHLSIYPHIVSNNVIENFIDRANKINKNLIIKYGKVKRFYKVFNNQSKDPRFDFFRCKQYKRCFLYIFGHFFKCTAAYGINMIMNKSIVDGIKLSDSNIYDKIRDHVLSDSKYKACCNCDVSKCKLLKKCRWSQMSKDSWIDYKKISSYNKLINQTYNKE